MKLRKQRNDNDEFDYFVNEKQVERKKFVQVIMESHMPTELKSSWLKQ